MNFAPFLSPREVQPCWLVPNHLHHLNKCHLRVPVRIWNIVYCILFILYYNFMTLQCGFSLPAILATWCHLRSRTCALWPRPLSPARKGAPGVVIFLRLSSTVAPVCTLFPSFHTSHACLPVAAPITAGLIAQYLWLCVSPKRPDLVRFASAWDIFFGEQNRIPCCSWSHFYPSCMHLTLWAFLWSFFSGSCAAAHPAITSPRPSWPSVLHAAHWKQPADQTHPR